MIEKFLESALVIDDKIDEVAALIDLLNSKEIYARYFAPEVLKERETILKNSKIIFLDLQIEEDKTTVENVAIIRRIFQRVIGPDFGSYGIVLWSKHTDEMEELRSRMCKDGNLYQLPLFIIDLDKIKYLKLGHYNDLLNDINAKMAENIASSFFINWSNQIETGKDMTLKSIYSLIPEYKNLQQDLQFILYRLALNHTGIPKDQLGNYRLENDALKAVTDILQYDIIHQNGEEVTLFPQPADINFSGDMAQQSKIFSSLNSKLLLDLKNIDQNVVMPGNVYKIVKDDCFFAMEDVPEGAVKILVEMTPPCDFAVDKKGKRSRVMGGFYVKEMSGAQTKKYSKDNFYKELDMLKLDATNDLYHFRFDFRYFGSVNEDELKDETRYEIFLRFKDKLYADVLQKLSSHTARLGIPFIK